MKCTIALLSLLLCVSCTLVSPTDSAVATAEKSIEALEKSLPDICKTEAYKAQIEALKADIKEIKTNCELQKETLRSDKAKWKIISLALVSLICLYFGMKFLK